MSQHAPGWYPDPQGGPQQRWWDGSKWTDATRPLASQQPQQPQVIVQKSRAGRIALFIVLGILGLGVLGVVGCVALIGAGVDEAAEELEARGITRAEFDSIEQGMTQEEVESQLGPPEDSQEFEQQIPELQDQPSKSSCIYYPESGKPLFEGDSFQLCFDEGKLTSKNAY
jgi:hypothetical protein